MNWYESINEIRKQQQNNQLVVFVGAGISKNSGLPSWWELIKKIAKKIDYCHKNQCINCKLRSIACPKGITADLFDYSQDEFLRIPEYFYQIDTSKGHKKYYRFIVNALKSDGASNPIDDEIFSLLPHHIITTNYDSLLEGSTNNLSKLYTLVTQDSDLLSKASDRYIIKMHAYLRALTFPDLLEQFIPLSNVLKEKYAALDCYRKVSHYDLVNSQHLGRISFESMSLIFYDKNWYDSFATLVKANDQNMIHIFQKAGIRELYIFPEESPLPIPTTEESEDPYFNLYLNNDYIALQKAAQECNDLAGKAFYLYITGASSQEVFSTIEKSYLDLPKENYYIAILIGKIRERIIKLTPFNRQKELTNEINQLFATCPKQYENAIGFLRMIYNSTADQAMEMQELLDKQEKRNKYGRSGWESGHAFTHIWKLQAIAYDYYFFIRKNYIPLDYYTDSKNYLSYYIQAILCSYSPYEISNGADLFDIPTHHQHYSLSDIDLDIIVKFSNPKQLSSWLMKYNVETLEIEKSVNILKKYENLCNSFISLSVKYWAGYIKNLTVVILSSNVNSDIKDQTVSTFVDSFINASKINLNLCIELLETLNFLVQNAADRFSKKMKNLMLKTILDEKVYKTLKSEPSSPVQKMIEIFAPSIEEELVEQQLEYIEKQDTIQEKLTIIYERRFLLPQDKYRDLIENNVERISSDRLFHLLVEERIQFTSDIQARFVDTIKMEHEKRIAEPSSRSYPDWLQRTLDECVILKILGYHFDINTLQAYKEYSLQLQFMLDPDAFDYSLINTKDHMWQNLLFSTEYGEVLKKHKEAILTPELKKLFKMGLETKTQQKIVYGVLLDQEELRRF